MLDTRTPGDLYTIQIYDHSGRLWKTLQGWDRLEFSQRINDPWNHSIQLTVAPNNSLCQDLRSIPPDYFVLITRYDPVTQVSTLVYEGFHATVSEQTQLDGNIFFNLYGGGYTKLLERRLVLPPPGLENSEKSGYGETIVKDYVYDSCIRPTGILVTQSEETREESTDVKTIETRLIATFIDQGRIMPGFHVVPTENRGLQTSYSARFTNLESVVKAIIEKSGLDYGIYGSVPPGQFWFDCRPVWGLDRRVDNQDGNPPTIFSLELGNMLIPILSTNHRHEKNYFYAGGSGEGALRQLLQFSNDEAIAASPWGRSELFVSASSEDTMEGLLQACRDAEAKRGTKYEMEFGILMTRSIRWPRDWGLGDLVTAYYRDYRADKQISEIRVVVSPGQQQVENITVELKEVT